MRLIGLLRHKSEFAFDLCEVDKGLTTQVSKKSILPVVYINVFRSLEILDYLAFLWSLEITNYVDQLHCAFLSQVDGPLYKLLLKKEKAHEMDVNSVQWSPGVSFFRVYLGLHWKIELLSIKKKAWQNFLKKPHLSVIRFSFVNDQEKRLLASASDDGTIKIWELASLCTGQHAYHGYIYE